MEDHWVLPRPSRYIHKRKGSEVAHLKSLISIWPTSQPDAQLYSRLDSCIIILNHCKSSATDKLQLHGPDVHRFYHTHPTPRSLFPGDTAPHHITFQTGKVIMSSGISRTPSLQNSRHLFSRPARGRFTGQWGSQQRWPRSRPSGQPWWQQWRP